MRAIWFILLITSIISCKSDQKTIRIKGSDTEVNLAVSLAETYHRESGGQLISISGGGSGMGIASLLNGTADIANSSREMKQEEIDLFTSRNIQIEHFIFAQDAVAFVVSSKNSIDSVSTEMLAKYLSGFTNTWIEGQLKGSPVTIYGRQSNSGTYDYVKERLGIEFSPYAKQMNGNAQILEAIKKDGTGIGYVGAGYLKTGANDGLKVLRVYQPGDLMAYSPLKISEINSGLYYFQRPLYQFFKAEDLNKLKSFLDYEAGSQGLKIITDSGYYPVKSDHES